ncbi:hypothetical protein ASPBRDRAFT_666603, partial [Aspergillus brasiliensis CBS 101740]
ACRTIPPVRAEYSPIGTYETLGDLKTYKIGPVNATAAILIVYNIFGFCPQILQGADLLAQATNAQAYMPDFLNGEVADHSWLPPDTEEKMKAFSIFIQGPPCIPRAVCGTLAVLNNATERNRSRINRRAALGFCLGCGAVASQAGAENAFVAAGGAHPSFMYPDDGTTITILFRIHPSKDED